VTRTRRTASVLLAVAAALLVPAVAAAHPLGNFTINHYAGVRVAPDRVLLDVVIDRAEIPTFEIRRDLDVDGDGEFSAAELDGLRASGCAEVRDGLTLLVGGTTPALELTSAGVSFPMGIGGLPTMRLVCQYDAPLGEPIAGPTAIRFEDRFLEERVGWREIVVTLDGTATPSELPAPDTTERLTRYPTDQLVVPRDDRSVSFIVSPGGPALPPFVAPDAEPIVVRPASPAPGSTANAVPSPSPAGEPASIGSGAVGAVPGGVGSLPAILLADHLDPLLALIAIATSALLGVGHALTPGHGKTLMAAYLVGTRGTPLHAAGLGLSVSLSHTLGILGLSVVVIAAQRALPPDVVVRTAPAIAAVTIVGIGAWMLVTEFRRWRQGRRMMLAHAGSGAGAHVHANEAAQDLAHGDEHGHQHEHEHDHHEHEHDEVAGSHSHGGIRHTHVPPPGRTISWKSLFVLGLAGGLVPSTNALLILLSTIAAGRPVWGIVLVAAFGIGMALVMIAVGVAFVYAREFMERLPRRETAARAARLLPLAAACLVIGIGLVLTGQAMTGAVVL
jgi:ABC-type nickel/cobalt efflux system permease component RcnA